MNPHIFNAFPPYFYTILVECSFLFLQGSGFSLSAYSANQVLKLGTSIDYGVCKGKRKDGMACTLVINKYVTGAADFLSNFCFC